MTALTVHTQAELDAALTNPAHTYSTHEIVIDTPAGVWITIGSDHGKDIRAWGSATVRASGSATVEAWDSATVEASGSATVRASGSATVEAWDSATVEASGSATVRAFGSATVRASESATVRASGSATVRASGSATVEASGSATVRASGSATVEASGLYVVTRRLSTSATVTGGVIIDCTTIDETDPATWGDYHGAQVEDGTVTLYKCLPQNLTSGDDWGRPTVWPTSGDIECDDFEATDECGHGLHLSPTPGHAWAYLSDESRPRFLEVTAPLGSIVPVTGGMAKCKVARCTVVREVDVMGRPVTSEAVES